MVSLVSKDREQQRTNAPDPFQSIAQAGAKDPGKKGTEDQFLSIRRALKLQKGRRRLLHHTQGSAAPKEPTAADGPGIWKAEGLAPDWEESVPPCSSWDTTGKDLLQGIPPSKEHLPVFHPLDMQTNPLPDSPSDTSGYSCCASSGRREENQM
ncbi:hypothetical protein GRJ2_002427200 [Grus japonensis]|uniref:Uncharacterized protein n=1 Tax=Grus japonensis TaxID=30415 RepID=A0ABC9XPG6_GRUJA